MVEGYGFGVEGDWKMVIFVCVVNVMGVGLFGGVSFMEDYIYDMMFGDEFIFGVYMFEVLFLLMMVMLMFEIYLFGIGGKDDLVWLVFMVDFGFVVVVVFSDMCDWFWFIVNVVENVELCVVLLNFLVGCVVWKL